MSSVRKNQSIGKLLETYGDVETRARAARLCKNLGVTAVLVGVSASGLAEDPALPAAAQTAMDGISSQLTAFINAAWPIVTTIVGAGIGIKLFRKFANKAT